MTQIEKYLLQIETEKNDKVNIDNNKMLLQVKILTYHISHQGSVILYSTVYDNCNIGVESTGGYENILSYDM
jgi:hypothetical protein